MLCTYYYICFYIYTNAQIVKFMCQFGSFCGSERHMEFYRSMGVRLVIRVHGPMGPFAFFSKDFLHVPGQREHYEYGWERHDHRAGQHPPDTQSEHNGPPSCRAFSSLEDSGPDHSFRRRTGRTCASRNNRGRANFELHSINRVRWLQESTESIFALH